MAIDLSRWEAVSPLLDRALELSVDERAKWLAALRVKDPGLGALLETLLEDARALDRDGFLECGPAASMAYEATLAGQTIGAYTLEAPLGHGGMGSVWLARRSDGRYEGKVAVKLLNAALMGRGGEERFRREGRVLAKLTHANVARILDAGVTQSSQPYLVLEYVEGIAFDRYCD